MNEMEKKAKCLLIVLGIAYLTTFTYLCTKSNEQRIETQGSKSIEKATTCMDICLTEEAEWYYTSLPKKYICKPPLCEKPVLGQEFPLDEEEMHRHGLPFKVFVNPTLENVKQFVFVTASSENHFEESVDAMAAVQHHFKDKKVLYYDWGLTKHQRQVLTTWCNVELIDFDFSSYRVFATMWKSSRTYFHVAKSLVIMDALRTYPAAIWMDASIRFKTGDLSQIYEKAVSNSGLVFFSAIGMHSTYEVTAPSTFNYLPTDKKAMQTNPHMCAFAYMVVRSHFIYQHILWWLYLCSSTRGCVLPTPELECHFPRERTGESGKIYRNCTRVDQSILNILARNAYGDNYSVYELDARKLGMMSTARQITHEYDIRICK